MHHQSAAQDAHLDPEEVGVLFQDADVTPVRAHAAAGAREDQVREVKDRGLAAPIVTDQGGQDRGVASHREARSQR
ncbi:hypothetical protein ANCDUO_05477 [Ancylostoma duodenale]|uniref:Uncharacterized protein n=1 Tax=Ancylostoma duodenale TaxID=51022 RepID=A0A0C2GSE4_9BILA|nr:hypothetical protein ANCDUO_05477 [Ancylostoma duodenale]